MQFSCRFNLAQWFVCDYNEVCSRGVAQSVARHVRDVEVAGSSPVAPTNCRIVACGVPLPQMNGIYILPHAAYGVSRQSQVSGS